MVVYTFKTLCFCVFEIYILNMKNGHLLSTGVLVDFISIPVTVGFTSATSVIIACSQLKGLLGLTFKANGFLDTVNKVWNHIPETRPWDATLGFTSIVVLLLLRVRCNTMLTET
jgi:MFS superfamily sulfate permease-like transporter